MPDPTATRAITVSWTPVNGTAANGRPVTQYTVYEYQAASSGGPFGGTPVSTQVVTGATSGSASFTVNNDSSWYEYDGHLHEPGRGIRALPAVHPGHPGRRPAGRADRRHGEGDRAERHDPVHLHRGGREREADQLHRVRDQRRPPRAARSPARSRRAAATPRPSPTRPSSAIVNGSAVTVYVAECNDAGLCSSWAGPSGQVIPYAADSDSDGQRDRQRDDDRLHLERAERRADRDPERLHRTRAPTTRCPRPAATAGRPPPPTATARRRPSPPTSPTLRASRAARPALRDHGGPAARQRVRVASRAGNSGGSDLWHLRRQASATTSTSRSPTSLQVRPSLTPAPTASGAFWTARPGMERLPP